MKLLPPHVSSATPRHPDFFRARTHDHAYPLLNI